MQRITLFLIFLAVTETLLMSVKVFLGLSQNRPCPVFKVHFRHFVIIMCSGLLIMILKDIV